MLLNEIEELIKFRQMHVEAIAAIDAQVNGAFDILSTVVGRQNPRAAQPMEAARERPKRPKWDGEGSRVEKGILHALRNGEEMRPRQIQAAVGPTANQILASMTRRGLLIRREEQGYTGPGRPPAFYRLASPAQDVKMVVLNGYPIYEERG